MEQSSTASVETPVALIFTLISDRVRSECSSRFHCFAFRGSCSVFSSITKANPPSPSALIFYSWQSRTTAAGMIRLKRHSKRRRISTATSMKRGSVCGTQWIIGVALMTHECCTYDSVCYESWPYARTERRKLIEIVEVSKIRCISFFFYRLALWSE